MTKDNSTGKPKDFYSRGQHMFDSLNLPDDDDDTQVYKKPWVGLTDEEVRFYLAKHRALVNAGYNKVADTNIITEAFNAAGFYKEIAAVLKERNT